VKQDEYTRYECKIGGSPEIKVLWYKDEVEIQESSKFRMSFEDSVAILEMHSLSVEDSGDYTCEARNAAGSASSSTSLKVKGQTSPHPHSAHPLFYSSLHAQFYFPPDVVLKLFKDTIKRGEGTLTK
jgi:hypothetical protein